MLFPRSSIKTNIVHDPPKKRAQSKHIGLDQSTDLYLKVVLIISYSSGPTAIFIAELFVLNFFIHGCKYNQNASVVSSLHCHHPPMPGDAHFKHSNRKRKKKKGAPSVLGHCKLTLAQRKTTSMVNRRPTRRSNVRGGLKNNFSTAVFSIDGGLILGE